MSQLPTIPASADARSSRTVRQCNADYRRTVPKIHAFLDALAESGRVADAARAVGMSRQAAYKLRAKLDGPKFRAAFEGARKEGIKARAAASVARSRSRWEGPESRRSTTCAKITSRLDKATLNERKATVGARKVTGPCGKATLSHARRRNLPWTPCQV